MAPMTLEELLDATHRCSCSAGSSSDMEVGR